MERDLTIHYKNNYFGSMTFFYDKYYQGNIWVQRKEHQKMTIDKLTKIDLTDIYSKMDRFDHPKVELSSLLALDRTNVYSSFEKDIDDKKLDRNAFNLYYSAYLPFSRLLYNKNHELIGSMTIIVNSVEQTKVFSFEPFHSSLDSLRQQIKVPFTKINNHILFEFCNARINNLFPDSYYR